MWLGEVVLILAAEAASNIVGADGNGCNGSTHYDGNVHFLASMPMYTPTKHGNSTVDAVFENRVIRPGIEDYPYR